jgi:hypothetical protein
MTGPARLLCAERRLVISLGREVVATRHVFAENRLRGGGGFIRRRVAVV